MSRREVRTQRRPIVQERLISPQTADEAVRELQDTRVIVTVLPVRVPVMLRHLAIDDEDGRMIRVGIWVGFACFTLVSIYTLIFD